MQGAPAAATTVTRSTAATETSVARTTNSAVRMARRYAGGGEVHSGHFNWNEVVGETKGEPEPQQEDDDLPPKGQRKQIERGGRGWPARRGEPARK